MKPIDLILEDELSQTSPLMDFHKYNIWWTQFNDLNSYYMYDAFSCIQIVKVSKTLFSTAYDSFIIFLAYGWYWPQNKLHLSYNKKSKRGGVTILVSETYEFIM